jgi:hypothetical protein
MEAQTNEVIHEVHGFDKPSEMEVKDEPSELEHKELDNDRLPAPVYEMPGETQPHDDHSLDAEIGN